MRLTNKTVLVTGANRGIGRAIAEELAKRPVHLLLGMRDVKSYRAIESGCALSMQAVVMDLSSESAIDRSVADLGDVKIDILINNAGQFVAGPLQEQPMAKVYAMFQVNIVGLAQLTSRLLPGMLERGTGKIVNNASIAGYAYLPDNSTYSATKAGVVAFSEALRRELDGTGVSVLHLVTPGVATEMLTDVEATYKGYDKPIELKGIAPSVWAKRVVAAIENDKTILEPTGSTRALKSISHLPKLVDMVSRRIFKKSK